MIYAVLGILALGAVAAMWLFRRGKKEASGEAAQEAIKNARTAASVDNDTGRLSDDAVRKRLLDKWTKE